MLRDPYADRSLDPRVAAVIAVVLTVLVVGGIGFAWQQFEQDVEVVAADTGSGSPTPAAEPGESTSGSEEQPTPESTETTQATENEAATSPTFAPVQGTDGAAPVVLLVGDGYAAGVGASSAGTSYASLLARDLGWDVRLATANGAGYTLPGSGGQTLPSLFASSPTVEETALVIVQGGYGGDAPNEDVKDTIAELAGVIDTRYPDVPVVAVGSFWPGDPTSTSETRERTIARAWRDEEGVLLLRPQPEGWSDFTPVDGAPDDAGHQQIAEAMMSAFEAAGLVSS